MPEKSDSNPIFTPGAAARARPPTTDAARTDPTPNARLPIILVISSSHSIGFFARRGPCRRRTDLRLRQSLAVQQVEPVDLRRPLDQRLQRRQDRIVRRAGAMDLEGCLV